MRYLFSRRGTRRFLVEFAMVGVLLVIMAPLAACGGGSSTSSTSSSNGPVTLTLWDWVPGAANSVALWNSTHPNIQVKLENVGSGPTEYTKLFTAIKANNEPDMAQIEFQYMPSFETTGALADISKYGANSVKSGFVPWTWNQVALAGGVYSVPEDSGPMALYYRADLFQKYNIPVPTTWAQYADDAAKLHAADPKAYITDFPPKEPGWFTGLVWQNGGEYFSTSGNTWKVSVNNPQAQQVAAYWQDLIDKKLVKTDPDFTNAWYNDLQTGAVTTWVSAVWGAGTLEQNAPQTSGKWRVAPLPQWSSGQAVAGNWGGSTFAVFKSSQHPQEATQFDIWLQTNQQSLDAMIKGANIYPAYAPALDSPSVNGPNPFFGNQALGPLFKTASTQVNVNFQWGPTIAQVYNDMGNQFANVVNGQGTLSQGLDAVQQSTITYMQKQGFNVST